MEVQAKSYILRVTFLEEAEKAQKGAMETDERVGMVEEYLNTPYLRTGMIWICLPAVTT